MEGTPSCPPQASQVASQPSEAKGPNSRVSAGFKPGVSHYQLWDPGPVLELLRASVSSSVKQGGRNRTWGWLLGG